MSTNPVMVVTRDMYEAVYYLVNGATVESLELVRENNQTISKFTLSGEESLALCQQSYFAGSATVNLYAFRRMYRRMMTMVTRAKTELKQKEKESKAVQGVQV